MTISDAPYGMPTATSGKPSSRFVALYRLMLRVQLSRARALALVCGGILAVLVALVLRGSGQSDQMQVGALLIGEYGLWLLVPITALLLCSATLGEIHDDGTLVYLWLRPVPRWMLAMSAFVSSLTVALPVTLIPLLLAALLTGAPVDLAIGVLVTVPLSLLAYCGIFTALGLKSRRSFVWGLLYIFIIEGFVARGGDSLAKLAIRSYSESVLADITGANLAPFAVIASPYSWIVPLAAALLGVLYTIRRLHVQDIP